MQPFSWFLTDFLQFLDLTWIFLKEEKEREREKKKKTEKKCFQHDDVSREWFMADHEVLFNRRRSLLEKPFQSVYTQFVLSMRF